MCLSVTGLASILDCDFEGDTPCQYDNHPDSHFNWTVVQGWTLSPGTGPLYDHTTRSSHGFYALAEASGRYWLDQAQLTSPQVTLQEDYCLRFYFHMYGKDVDQLQVPGQNLLHLVMEIKY